MMEEAYMADNYSIVEPLGNRYGNSKLERYWKGFEGKYGLRTSRIIQFDPYASMSRCPVKYILEKFELCQDTPDEKWIEDNLKLFIREEAMRFAGNMPQNFPPKIDGEIFLPDEFLESYLSNSEWENLIKMELPKDDSYSEMARCIYGLLCNPKIGSSKNAANNDKDTFIGRVLPLLEQKKRLFFILPGFPFKDQNRFRVPYDASFVDFSEISFLIRLHNLIQTLYQVHPFGAEALVLSDGRLYQDIFYIDSKNVEDYQWRLHDFRNKLNIQGDVSIIDLKDLIERADESGEISKIIKYIEKVISDQFKGKDFFQVLVQGMKWNMNSRKLLEDYSDIDAWSILRNDRNDIKNDLLEVWDWYHKIAEEAAVKYTATNLMLKWTDLLQKFFPESIRCTVHPKENQFALAMNYAWNGVAWSEKWPRNINDISTVPFYTLEDHKIKLVRFKSNHYPCFFTEESYDQMLDYAKNVLKADGWNVDNIFGREFSIYDLNEFVELGRGDENFAWERQKMSDEYYKTLLQFRISHYKKYGFGVHAIFVEGHLVGQMGLQVLDEQKKQLEYVIFLGKDYTQKGIGTKLLKYLFDRCKDEGIETIYGVIRSDNDISKHIINKFGGRMIKTMAHYHQTGILYEIKLK